ncbi:MAG: hypothetical protein IJ438_11170 [Clostridia bacterium]|nr:hypothetical protein [Clostridia bacterium]
MQNFNKLRGLMGLCVRARQAVFGEDGCLKTIRAGNCGLLLLDSGASKATQEKYHGACQNANVTVGLLPEGMLHEATGKPGVAMAVLSGGLAQQMKQQLPVMSGEMQPMKSANHSGGASVE